MARLFVRPPKTPFRYWAVLMLLLLIGIIIYSGWGAPVFLVLARTVRLTGMFLLQMGAVLAVLFVLLILVLGGIYHLGRPAATTFTDYCRQQLRRIFLK